MDNASKKAFEVPFHKIAHYAEYDVKLMEDMQKAFRLMQIKAGLYLVLACFGLKSVKPTRWTQSIVLDSMTDDETLEYIDSDKEKS